MARTISMVALTDNTYELPKKVVGVYIIQSISNPNRVYVGSSIELERRCRVHFALLKRNSHSSLKLQNHYNKYGENDLVFETIESGNYLDKNHLLSREQGWFTHFSNKKTNIPYFNIAQKAGSNIGFKYTDEQRKRRSEQQLGEKNHQFGNHGTELTNKKKSLSHIGKRHTEESKQKNSESQKKRPPESLESRKKRSEKQKGKIPWNKGIPHKQSTKDKISIATKGRISWNQGKKGLYKPTEESKIKASKALKGKKKTPETIERMKAAWIKRKMKSRI